MTIRIIINFLSTICLLYLCTGELLKSKISHLCDTGQSACILPVINLENVVFDKNNGVIRIFGADFQQDVKMVQKMMNSYLPYRSFGTKFKLVPKIPVVLHSEKLDTADCKKFWRGPSAIHLPWHTENMFMIFNYNIFRLLGPLMLYHNISMTAHDFRELNVNIFVLEKEKNALNAISILVDDVFAGNLYPLSEITAGIYTKASTIQNKPLQNLGCDVTINNNKMFSSAGVENNRNWQCFSNISLGRITSVSWTAPLIRLRREVTRLTKELIAYARNIPELVTPWNNEKLFLEQQSKEVFKINEEKSLQYPDNILKGKSVVYFNRDTDGRELKDSAKKALEKEFSRRGAKFEFCCDWKSIVPTPNVAWIKTSSMNLISNHSTTLTSKNALVSKTYEPLTRVIRLVANSHIVMGMHGAGFGNALFARPGSVIVEMFGIFAHGKPSFMMMSDGGLQTHFTVDLHNKFSPYVVKLGSHELPRGIAIKTNAEVHIVNGISTAAKVAFSRGGSAVVSGATQCLRPVAHGVGSYRTDMPETNKGCGGEMAVNDSRTFCLAPEESIEVGPGSMFVHFPLSITPTFYYQQKDNLHVSEATKNRCLYKNDFDKALLELRAYRHAKYVKNFTVLKPYISDEVNPERKSTYRYENDPYGSPVNQAEEICRSTYPYNWFNLADAKPWRKTIKVPPKGDTNRFCGMTGL